MSLLSCTQEYAQGPHADTETTCSTQKGANHYTTLIPNINYKLSSAFTYYMHH